MENNEEVVTTFPNREIIPVDLTSFIFNVIEYDPTENPRGVVTADEWNTIMHLLKTASNYTSESLQAILKDLYTATELSSAEPMSNGASLIGFPAGGVLGETFTGTNVYEAIKYVYNQALNATLGEIMDGSIGSDKLADNLDFRGDTLTFNGKKILTELDIKTAEGEDSSTALIPSYTLLTNTLTGYQDKITYSTAVPDNNTPGTIYLQYVG